MFSLRYAYGNVIETGKTRTIMAYRLYINCDNGSTMITLYDDEEDFITNTAQHAST